jgi:GNAT superfamily N-acetyltransferase
MNIALLADHTEVLPALAKWYRDEWKPYYGIDGPGDALADLRSRCNKNALPIGLVALEGDQVQGVAALDLDVATNLMPSVVGLLVAVEYRGQGVATQLLDSAKNLAARLG